MNVWTIKFWLVAQMRLAHETFSSFYHGENLIGGSARQAKLDFQRQ